MTTYAAIQNPTDWNWKKCMNGWRREMRNYVTITNGRSLPPNTDILNDVIQQDGRLHTAIQQLWSLTKCLWFYDILDVFSKIIKELTHLLLFYHSELIYKFTKMLELSKQIKEQLKKGEQVWKSSRWKNKE